MIARLVVAAAFFEGATVAYSHGDANEAIDLAAAQIAAHPADGQLYLTRGVLHRSHEDWPAALADFERVVNLGGELAPVGELARGETLLLAGKVAEAVAVLDALIATNPKMSPAFAARGRCRVAAGAPAEAVADFHRAIEAAAHPEPALILECARAEQSAGNPGAALKTIDDAAAKYGPLVSFVDPAVAIEEREGQFNAAIARVDALMPGLARKETWLLRKAILLEKAGRSGEARTSLEQARAALETLPPERRRTAAAMALAQQISETEARLPKK